MRRTAVPSAYEKMLMRHTVRMRRRSTLAPSGTRAGAPKRALNGSTIPSTPLPAEHGKACTLNCRDLYPISDPPT